MNSIYGRIIGARNRMTISANMMRWIWLVNLIIAVMAFIEHSYTVAAVAGITWLFSLIAAAVTQRAAGELDRLEDMIEVE